MRVGQRNKWVQVLDTDCDKCPNKAIVSKTTDGVTAHRCLNCLTNPTTNDKRKVEVATLLRELGLL